LQRLQFYFSRGEELIYISHLDIMRLLQRAMRRAGSPLAHTKGYNPQPRLSIAAPLPVGVTAKREPAEVYLEQNISPSNFVEDFNRQLPRGILIEDAVEISEEAPPLMQVIDAALYQVYPFFEESSISPEKVRDGVEKIKHKEEITVRRKGKKGWREIDIRPFIYRLEFKNNDGEEKNKLELEMFLKTGSQGGARPGEIVNLLGEMLGSPQLPYQLRLNRVALYRRDGQGWTPA